MRASILLFLLVFSSYYIASAQTTCMTAESIKLLDSKWEEANLHPNPDFFETTLGEEFVWVHNHGTMVDSKWSVVERAKKQKAAGTSNTRSRSQRDVKVAISGNTAVVTGITVVDRGPQPTTYHFMRTYVEIGGKCYLIGNHTMAIPKEEL
ncbi:nuclear transport factor 2 family protein [Algoriphagus lutimaris]|uniref:nuclear transport factor 2 family protein n=1 Tax=Algoriphagus lutimaris TaxID=613197 RepID=UPI00196BA1B5|nr:nuclear transport factor 2 family protein [Algoriphagus lutimaris]MBN3518442.1 nuclear transport factor 2 family protein [Algoriphagus lutimaris]